MIKYTWKIEYTEYYKQKMGLEGVISKIRWYYIGLLQDTGEIISIDGILDLPEPTPESFISMNDLKRDELIGWLESYIDTEYLRARMSFDVEEKIEAGKSREALVRKEFISEEEDIESQKIFEKQEWVNLDSKQIRYAETRPGDSEVRPE